MTHEHDHKIAEELLEFMLETRRGTHSTSGPSLDTPEAVELGRDLDRIRQSLGDPATCPELEDSILAQTTRADLRRRGDLRLVRDYIMEGVRSSTLIRVAAASLLVHLVTLPLLAYYVFTASSPAVELGYEDWEDAYPVSPYPERVEDEPTPDLPVVNPEQEPDVRSQQAKPQGGR